MCSSAFFSWGVCQFTTYALVRNTRLCRKVTFVICTLSSFYPPLALGHRPYLLPSQYRCPQQCNIRTLDTSTWNLLELQTFFLEESGSPAALQMLLSFTCPVRCKVAPHVFQVVQDSIKSHYLLHSFAAAISDTIPTTIATAIASNLIMNWDLFVFHFFQQDILTPFCH